MKKIISLLLTLFLAGPAAGWAAEPVTGVSFSVRQCDYLKLDWRESYLRILAARPGLIRLGAYWSGIERQDDVYDYAELDWLILRAKEAGVPVLLTVGMKAPRWPEFYLPDWILARSKPRDHQKPNRYPLIRDEALEFVQNTVRRYGAESAIRYWQVENEPFDPYGWHSWRIDESFVQAEIAAVRNEDPLNRPIILNTFAFPHPLFRLASFWTGQSNNPARIARLADIAAFNVYTSVGVRWFGIPLVLRTSRDSRLRELKRLAQIASGEGKPAWITELQAEPWEPGSLIHEGAEHPRSFAPAQITAAWADAREAGITAVLLWGAEYWVSRSVGYGDNGWLETAAALFGGIANRDADAAIAAKGIRRVERA